jgi:hypothetical protein
MINSSTVGKMKSCNGDNSNNPVFLKWLAGIIYTPKWTNSVPTLKKSAVAHVAKPQAYA